MNTKIIASILMIGMISIGLGAGTLAYFNDTETAVDNTFTAGTIDIAVDGENPWKSTYQVRVDDDNSNAPDLKPCQVGYIRYKVENVGTNPLNLWKMISNINYNTGITDYKDFSSEPEYTYAHTHNGGIDANDIGTYIYFDLIVNGKVLIKEPYYTVDKPNKAPKSKGYVVGKWMYLGQIPAGETMLVEESFHLYHSTTNIYQGDVMIFDETLWAGQCEGYKATPDGEILPDLDSPTNND